MRDGDVLARMRADWNQRAVEDARYYVAFGRRRQSEEEFEATAADVVRHLQREFARLDPARPAASRRALEIGCGPGRLMRPLSGWFGEIYGIDISDEMIRQARERLAGIAHAHVRVTEQSDLAGFADDFFDFVYSYAVFQHIPSREVVFGYLEEAWRVLREGGIFKAQLNGLPPQPGVCDTWTGVRVAAGELREYARRRDWQLLALEGDQTQYLWCTMAKRRAGWRASLAGRQPLRQARIRRVTNAFSSEPVVPAGGRFACASLWLENPSGGRALEEFCDLTELWAQAEKTQLACSYLGPPERDGMQQVNVPLGGGLRSGVHALELYWRSAPVSEPGTLRVIPPPARVPRLVSVSDGVNLLAGTQISSRTIKFIFEELEHPKQVSVRLEDVPLEGAEIFCADPLPPRYEINFHVPPRVSAGRHVLLVAAGRRTFPPLVVEIAP